MGRNRPPPDPAARPWLATLALVISGLLIVLALLVTSIGPLLRFMSSLAPTPTPIPPPTPVVAPATEVPAPATAEPATEVLPTLPPVVLTQNAERLAVFARAAATADADAATAATTATAESAAARATWTALVPTPVPPTVTPPPVLTLADWEVDVERWEYRDQLVWSSLGNAVGPSGRFVVVYLAARNLQNASRSLFTTFDFTLEDDHAAQYTELTGANRFTMADAARILKRDALTATITPRGSTNPMVVFDIATDARPAKLTVAEQGLFSNGSLIFTFK